jgi:hypothetical protein
MVHQLFFCSIICINTCTIFLRCLCLNVVELNVIRSVRLLKCVPTPRGVKHLDWKDTLKVRKSYLEESVILLHISPISMNVYSLKILSIKYPKFTHFFVPNLQNLLKDQRGKLKFPYIKYRYNGNSPNDKTPNDWTPNDQTTKRQMTERQML